MTDPLMAARVIRGLSYKPGWSFKLGGPGSRFLCVMAETIDSQDREATRCTQHMFELPDGIDGERRLVRWVLDCLLLAEFHEATEFLEIDGFAPYFPNHQDEGSPYELVERWENP